MRQFSKYSHITWIFEKVIKIFHWFVLIKTQRIYLVTRTLYGKWWTSYVQFILLVWLTTKRSLFDLAEKNVFSCVSDCLRNSCFFIEKAQTIHIHGEIFRSVNEALLLLIQFSSLISKFQFLPNDCITSTILLPLPLHTFYISKYKLQRNILIKMQHVWRVA